MYIIEGNIGAGKSTFLQLMTKHMPYISVCTEPIHKWQNQLYGQAILTHFYQDPTRWAYTLETLILMSRVKEYRAEQTTTGCAVLERSIYSGYYCFAQNSYASGYLSDLEWHTYNTWFTTLAPTVTPPLGFIYLSVDPEIAYQRIKKRNRYAEKTISREYIHNIAQRHEQFLIKKQDILPSLQTIPVLTLDCNEDMENNRELLTEHVQAVQYFIHKTFRTPEHNLTQKEHRW